MEKFFNNAGPVKPEIHYVIDPLKRVRWDEIKHLIDDQRYFLLHAPRQTGKTSMLLAMMEVLNKEGKYTAVYANIEGAQAARGDIESGMDEVVRAIASSVDVYLHDRRLMEMLPEVKALGSKGALAELLSRFSRINDKPVVLFLDEVDALIGDTLLSLLRQIRSGYAQRPFAFPHSMILCGVRDIKDYRIHTSNQEIITGGSAFNIKAKSLTLGNFTFEEMRALWLQHTNATGQTFEESIFPELWEDTKGQPWLVNAMGYELTYEMEVFRDRKKAIALPDYWVARERLIQSRATHLDQLTDKLKEPRVHRVIASLLSGEEDSASVVNAIKPDDIEYVVDLGLIRSRPYLQISNRIYQEIIPRELTWITQVSVANQEVGWYLNPDRSLNMKKLLGAFQEFFRENSEIWLERFEYKEAGPQLLIQAFLQRVINGGGRIYREYGLGRRRTDLLIEWPLNEKEGLYGPKQKIVIELKILRKALEATLELGLAQTVDYGDKANADELHLVIFNRNQAISWEDKIWHKEERYQNKTIQVWGA